MSKRILDLARDQQEEIARELGEDQWEDDEDEDEKAGPSVRGRPAVDSDDEDDELDEESMSGGEEYAELVRILQDLQSKQTFACILRH